MKDGFQRLLKSKRLCHIAVTAVVEKAFILIYLDSKSIQMSAVLPPSCSILTLLTFF